MMWLRLLLIVPLVSFISGSNILFVTDVASPSHQMWNYEIAAALLDKGHNITMFGASPAKGQGQKNYHIIDIEGLMEATSANWDGSEGLEEVSTYGGVMILLDYGLYICNHALHSKGLQTLRNYPENFKFDLIIYDLTCTTCLLPLIQRFNYPPTVAVTAFLLPSYLSEMFGNGMQPSYLPFYGLKYDDNPTFFQRLVNHFWLRVDIILRRVYLQKISEGMALEVFGKKMDSLDSLQDHVSLVLCNLIPGYHYAQPMTPNIIPVGGLHINPSKKLSEDLQGIMDSAKDGVILFSLGSSLQSSKLKEDKKKAIIDALGQLKQTVLWKFEAELDGLPKNIIIRKWLPGQRAILAHPNLRLFISHGGALSTIEAAYFGVPVVGIPFIVDQHMNIQIMEKKKLAVKVDYSTMTSTILLKKINEVLHNPMYSENSKKMSRIIRDQPETPLERAIFWLEYAIRHNGTHHLNPVSRHLPLFVSSSMDVYLFILFVLVTSVFLSLKCMCLLKRSFCSIVTSKKLKSN